VKGLVPKQLFWYGSCLFAGARLYVKKEYFKTDIE